MQILKISEHAVFMTCTALC